MACVNTNSIIMWSLGKWLILGLGKGIDKVNLEHLGVSEGKEVLKKKIHSDGSMPKGYSSQLKKLPMTTAGASR